MEGSTTYLTALTLRHRPELFSELLSSHRLCRHRYAAADVDGYDAPAGIPAAAVRPATSGWAGTDLAARRDRHLGFGALSRPPIFSFHFFEFRRVIVTRINIVDYVDYGVQRGTL